MRLSSSTVDRHRAYSGALSLSYVLAMLIHDGWRSALALCVPLLVPWLLIWHGEAVGSYTGWAGRARIDQPSPRGALRILGWVLLLAPLLIITVRWLS